MHGKGLNRVRRLNPFASVPDLDLLGNLRSLHGTWLNVSSYSLKTLKYR